MRVDSHNHFWKYDPVRDSWMDDSMESIRRNFMPVDFLDILKANDIGGTVAVQADQSAEETKFLLSLSKKHPEIVGVVGWVDLQSPDIVAQLAEYALSKKLVGFRHIVQGESDPDFMQRPDFVNGISHLGAFNFTYDILIFPHQLSSAIELVQSFPNQRFIVDHLAKPYIKKGLIKEWNKNIRRLGAFTNVYCKVSGMVTEANWQEWDYEDLVPYMDVVVDAFGINRLMFGSDWPVCLLAASYRQVLNITEKYFSSFSTDEQKLFFGQNAIDCYNLQIE